MFSFKGKKILVFGLKRSGLQVIQLLNKHGIPLFLTDDEVKPKDLTLDLTLNTYVEKEELEALIPTLDLIVKSPGIPDSQPMIKRALDHKITILNEIEIAYQFMAPGKKLIAITGTNGKTTTTTLLTKILNHMGLKATSCGNIGYPLSEAVLVDLYDVFVCECSSFQLNNIDRFKPDVAMILNLTPNHLDYHETFEAYKRAKFQLFKNMNKEDAIIYYGDDRELESIKDLPQKTYRYSLTDWNANGYYNKETGEIFCNGEPYLDVRGIKLQGQENIANVMACILAAQHMGYDVDKVKEAILGFEPLKYRIEYIGEWQGVKFYNDSKATNATATMAAIHAIDTPLILIVGGKLKEDRYEELFKDERIKCVIAYGENRNQMKAYCDEAKKICFICLNLLEVMRLVRKIMVDGDTVLFSPGAQSFDQYQNYVERGEDFNQLFHTVIEF